MIPEKNSNSLTTCTSEIALTIIMLHHVISTVLCLVTALLVVVAKSIASSRNGSLFNTSIVAVILALMSHAHQLLLQRCFRMITRLR